MNHYHLNLNSNNSKEKDDLNSYVNHNPTDISKFYEERNLVDYSIYPTNEFSSYNRIDSFISAGNEYSNFYLLNLIIKLNFSFRNKKEYYKFIECLQNTPIIYDNNKQNKNSNTEITDPSNLTKELKDRFYKILTEKIEIFYENLTKFHFNLQYIVLSLITQKRVKIFYFDFSFFNKIPKNDCIQQDIAAFVLESILKHHNKLDSYCLNLSEIFSYYFDSTIKIEMLKDEEKEKDEKDSDMMRIRTILVTPSIIYYKPPTNEKINQILRKYHDYKENFVKVNFVDEEKTKFFFCSPNNYVLLDFLKINMLSGLKIGTRTFNFLSASNSQMKNSSYWYFNIEGTKFTNIEQIIRELGDFTKEHNIHKNAARRGQFLSTTSLIKELTRDQIELINDIKGKKGIFTDGIGQISLDLALECAKKFKYEYASAFQIRIGGVKGIVAVNPDLSEEILRIRPSMVKFESNDRELGVIRCSSFSQGFLNRQIIILLYSLGVPKSIFTIMLEKAIANYDYLVTNPNKALKENKYNMDYLKKCYYFAPAVDHFVYNGINVLNDPILSSIMKTIGISRILDLKLKGKIMDKYSAVLIGVIDETNTLKEGEVYVNIKQDNYIISKNIDGESFIIQSDIIVTKNPCLHPGDIKILKAVRPEDNKLYHMVNVIVFSSKGERPIQNEISGGDLDGDSYFVSWNRHLINGIKIKDINSADDPKNLNDKITKLQANKEIKMREIVNSYIEYMKNDTIAMISNYHIALADKDLELGAFNNECLRLSDLFSIAIDAPKHGNFISVDQVFSGKKICEYPDFLEIAGFTSYDSPGVIGELYRLIDNKSYLVKYKFSEYSLYYLENYLICPLFVSENCYKYLKEAYKIYSNFNSELSNLIEIFKISSEAELFLSETIFERKKTKNNKQPDTFSEINNLKLKYSSIINKSFETINFDVASAIYLATYLNNKSLMEFKSCKLNMKKLQEFINVLIVDGRVDKDIYQIKNFETIIKTKLDFVQYYDSKNGNCNNKSCRNFSLPYIIKEVKDKLFRK